MKHHLFRVVSALMACVLLLACFIIGYAAEADISPGPQIASAKRSGLPADSLAVKSIALTDTQGKELNKLCDEHQQSQQAKPQSSTTSVKKRDWSKYTSHNAAISRLSSAEREFYKRLDSAARTYIEQPSHYVSKDGFIYIDENIRYSDLGLSADDATSLHAWFLACNPQYYFLSEWCGYSSDILHMCIYDFVKCLDDEAKVTNEMFDKLDSWIADCSKNTKTTWDKIISINDKICANTIYSPAVLAGNENAIGGENQTIYSVLMTPETVCAGYAATFTVMANAMGIDSCTVCGSHNDAGHDWNAAQFDDGKYYYVDVCWNDTDDSRISVYTYIGRGKEDTSHQYGKLVEPYAPAISPTSYYYFGRLGFGDGSVYTGGWKNGCKDGYGRLVNSNGSSDEGIWKEDKLNGMGISISSGGSGYYGDWSNGKEDGYGVFTYPSGAMHSALWARGKMVDHFRFETDTFSFSNGTYRGTVRNGYPNYYGKAEFNNGDVYIGYWKDGTPNGTGKYTWTDGSYYFGEWDNGARTGQGVFCWSNGNIYVGSFLNAKLDGQGRFIWPNGQVYEGEWKNDQQSGYGVMRYSNGEIYSGEWKNDMREGQGKYTWPNGQVYEGEWKNGQYDGYGTLTAADGTQKSGQWKNGQFVDSPDSGTTNTDDNNTPDPDDNNTPDPDDNNTPDPDDSSTTDETLTWESENGTYTGEMKNGLCDGSGRMEFEDGSSYEGEWKDGTMAGKGKYTWADGKVYEGEFKNGKGDGYGTLTYPDGTKKSGQWKNGKFVG